MSLGYSDEILPYPAIEYIPLDINTKNFNNNWINSYQPKLYIFNNLETAQKKLKKYQINYLPNIKLNNHLLLLLINAKAEDIYYRGYKAQMIGKLRPNSYHLFTIPSQYFYKDRIIFNFYLVTAEKILKKSYQIN